MSSSTAEENELKRKILLLKGMIEKQKLATSQPTTTAAPTYHQRARGRGGMRIARGASNKYVAPDYKPKTTTHPTTTTPMTNNIAATTTMTTNKYIAPGYQPPPSSAKPSPPVRVGEVVAPTSIATGMMTTLSTSSETTSRPSSLTGSNKYIAPDYKPLASGRSKLPISSSTAAATTTTTTSALTSHSSKSKTSSLTGSNKYIAPDYKPPTRTKIIRIRSKPSSLIGTNKYIAPDYKPATSSARTKVIRIRKTASTAPSSATRVLVLRRAGSNKYIAPHYQPASGTNTTQAPASTRVVLRKRVAANSTSSNKYIAPNYKPTVRVVRRVASNKFIAPGYKPQAGQSATTPLAKLKAGSNKYISPHYRVLVSKPSRASSSTTAENNNNNNNNTKSRSRKYVAKRPRQMPVCSFFLRGLCTNDSVSINRQTLNPKPNQSLISFRGN
jgi:hypothetical protein